MSALADKVNRYLAEHAVPEKARGFIREAALDVSRDVGGTRFPSVVTEFQSDKMQVTVNTESSTGELAFALHLELDDDVEAYFEQLPPIDCLRTDKLGRKTLRAYRGDYLVLHRDGPRVIQIKDADKADSLLLQNPSDWVRRDDEVVDLPALYAFQQIGIPHSVVLNTDMPQIRVANLRTLSRVRALCSDPHVSIVSRINDLLKQRSIVRLCELLEELDLTSASPVLRLILRRELFADLDRQLLTSTESCLISGNKRLLAEFIDCQMSTSFKPPNGSIGIEAAPTRKAAERALEKLELVRSGATSRSARRWREQIRKSNGVPPFLVMLPKHHLSGNRLSKRPRDVLDFAQKSVCEHWATKERPSVSSAYGLYRSQAEKTLPGLAPVSHVTYAHLVDLEKQALAQKRGGHRLANALSSPSDVKKRAIRATRPFEHAQVDHCLAKIYCEVYRTRQFSYATRPWLTVLRDCYSGEPLARWVSFSRPSRVAVAMVIRSCARRHGKLPETVSVDKGGEFLSVYLSSLAAHYGFNLEIRPSSHSRFGGPIEQFFSLFRSYWLDRSKGNCTDIKNIRGVSGTYHPRNLKCMSLPSFLLEFDTFCHWFIHDKLSGLHTPFEIRKQGLDKFPFSGIPVTYDDAFNIATAVDHGKLSIDRSRGIKVGEEHYWHPELRRQLCKKPLEVRLEPENHSCIYVRADGNWLTARSTRYSSLAPECEAFRIAESLVVMDARDLKALAKQESKDALVRLWRHADQQFSSLTPQSPPAAEVIPAGEAQDLWSAISASAVQGVAVSAWE